MSKVELEVAEEYQGETKNVNAKYLKTIQRNQSNTENNQKQRQTLIASNQKLIAQTDAEAELLSVKQKTLTQMREEELANAKAVKDARKKNIAENYQYKH